MVNEYSLSIITLLTLLAKIWLDIRTSKRTAVQADARTGSVLEKIDQGQAETARAYNNANHANEKITTVTQQAVQVADAASTAASNASAAASTAATASAVSLATMGATLIKIEAELAALRAQQEPQPNGGRRIE